MSTLPIVNDQQLRFNDNSGRSCDRESNAFSVAGRQRLATLSVLAGGTNPARRRRAYAAGVLAPARALTRFAGANSLLQVRKTADVL